MIISIITCIVVCTLYAWLCVIINIIVQVAGNFHFAPGKSFQQHHVHGEIIVNCHQSLVVLTFHFTLPFASVP